MLQRLLDNVRLAFSEGITVDDGDQSDQNNNCRHGSLSRETEREATPDDWDQLVRMKQKNNIHYQAVKTGERVSSGGAVQCHRWPEMNKTNWNQMEFCKHSIEGVSCLAQLSHPAVAGLNPGNDNFFLLIFSSALRLYSFLQSFLKITKAEANLGSFLVFVYFLSQAAP